MRGLVHVVTLALVRLTARGAQAFCGFYVSGADTKLFANAVVLQKENVQTLPREILSPTADAGALLSVLGALVLAARRRSRREAPRRIRAR